MSTGFGLARPRISVQLYTAIVLTLAVLCTLAHSDARSIRPSRGARRSSKLGMTPVAESVESKHQPERLCGFGRAEAQGCYTSAPKV